MAGFWISLATSIHLIPKIQKSWMLLATMFYYYKNPEFKNRPHQRPNFDFELCELRFVISTTIKN